MADKLFSTLDVARITGHQDISIRRQAKVHNIGLKMGRDWVFTQEDIDKIIAVQKRGRPPGKKKPIT